MEKDYVNMSLEDLEKELDSQSFDQPEETEITEENTENNQPEETSENQTSEDVSTQEEQTVEEQPQEGTEKETLTTTTPSTYKIKADGKEYNFSIDDLVKLAPMAMNYTRKMQDIAPYRKMITAIGENQISQEDINLLIDIKKGNKEALNAFVNKLGVDPLDIESESKGYVPNDYGVDENTYRLNEIVAELEKDSTFNQTASIIQTLDNNSKLYLKANPDTIRNLHEDVKNGMFNKILPEAEKLAVLDGNKHSFLDYYISAGSALYQKELEASKAKQAQKANKETAVRANKVNASLPKNASSTANKVLQYMSDIDEDDFKEWKKSVGLD